MKKPGRKVSVKPVIRVFGEHLKRYRIATFFFVTGRVIGVGIGVLIPLYYKELLDAIAGSPVPTAATALVLIGILYSIIGLMLVRWVATRSASFSSTYLQPRVMRDLSQTAFASITEHSYSFFTNNFTGSLVRKVSRLSRAFEQVADQVFDNIIPLVVTLTGIVIVLFLRSPVLGSIFLTWTIVVIALQFLIARWLMRYSLEAAEKDSESTGILSDSIANDTTVKLFSGLPFERMLFKKSSDEAARLRFMGWSRYEVINSIQAAMTIIIEFALMYAGIKLWQQGVITIGDFALIQAYVIAAIDQMWSVGGAIRRSYEAFADATEMVDIMNLPVEVTDRPGAQALQVTDGTIEFRKADFSFNAEREVFSDFDLHIAGHEKVALVGPSGAGKTTITKLLLRFHDLTDGEILIDGQDIAGVTQLSLRDAIAFVPQEPVLFHRTLMENIRYGRRDATDDEVIQAAKKAHCYDFVMQSPEGFDTYVGERGIKLSGGERQRIAIARAILKDAPILILDEATSSLDSESEELIQDALAKLMEGKTVIAIAHRLSTVMKMDRIIVIEDGRVAMSGTHADLLSHEGGLYKKLWEIQAGGFISNDLDLSA